MKPFIVMTTGRSGSSALMDCLETHGDIVVPHRQAGFGISELLHPKWARQFAAYYRDAAAMPVRSDLDLVRAFFRANAGAAYAGFKTMPNRHADYARLAAEPGIRFIALYRRDIPSTVASFIAATEADTWGRTGGAQAHTLTFDPALAQRARSHLAYVVKAWKRMDQLPGAIRLFYEDLCDPAYRNDALDAFFGRPVRIADPKPPTDASHYVTGWADYCAFIASQFRQLTAAS